MGSSSDLVLELCKTQESPRETSPHLHHLQFPMKNGQKESRMVQRTSSAENWHTQQVLGTGNSLQTKFFVTEAIILTFHLDTVSNLEVVVF